MKKNIKRTTTVKNKSKLDIRFKLIINGIIIVILFFGSIFLFTVANNINVESKKEIISYEEKSDISYTISIKPNQFYQTTTLGMNQYYPSAIIDKINIKFKYKFNTSKESNYSYRYFTTATLIANNSNADIATDNINLLNKTYQLENEIKGQEQNKKEFDLEKNYVIDYNYYNSFISAYKNTYDLSIDTYLKVKMYVEVIDNYQEVVINNTKMMEVNIPLLTNPVGINITNPDDVSHTLYQDISKKTSSKFFNILALIMLISSILLFIQEFKKVLKSDREQSKYIKELNKIIIPNSEIIIRVKNKINLKSSNIIEVETIEALLDAQNELRIPIAYFETKRNKEGCFVIVNGKEAWRYVLKVEDEK